MEEVKNSIEPELIVTEGKAFHFTDNNLDEVLIVNNSGENKYQFKNQNYPLYKLMKHPKWNVFLDELGLGWIYQNIPYPELYITKDHFANMITKEIPDVLSFSHLLLQEYNLHQYIDSKSFYKLVLNNIHIDTYDRLINACQLLKVNCKLSSIDEIHLYLKEIINDNNRAKIIEKYSNADIKINLSKTTHHLEKEWFNIEASYTGEIELPESFFLCKSLNDFRKLNCNNWYIKESGTIDNMIFKHKFFIGCISNEKILFEVEPIKGTGWFTFRCRSAHNDSKHSNETINLGYALAQKNNQLFFQRNYKNTNPLNINTKNSLADLLDNVL